MNSASRATWRVSGISLCPNAGAWIRKLQARVLAGDYRSAVDAASKAQPLLWTSPSFFETAEYEFYGGLAQAGFCDSIPSEEQPPHRNALSVHHGQLDIWATHCPENFESRAALVGAEIARVSTAASSMPRSCTSRQSDQHANTASSRTKDWRTSWPRDSTRRARFDDIAHLYLRRARQCYARWGADGKVRQLDERFPRLRKRNRSPTRAPRSARRSSGWSSRTVLKVSQAVSREIVLDKLVDTVLRTAIEHAGADRGRC